MTPSAETSELVRAAGVTAGAVALVVGFYLAFLAPSLSAPLPNESDTPYIVLLTVDGESPYRAWMSHLATELRRDRDGPRICTRTTTGSLDTLIRIEQLATGGSDGQLECPGGRVEGRPSAVFGIAQADALWHYVNGDGPGIPRGREGSRARSVARVLRERFIIRRGKRSKAESLDALLLAPHLCAEKLGSGSQFTTRNVGRILHASWQSTTYCPDNEARACAPTLHYPCAQVTADPVLADDPGLIPLTEEAANMVHNALPAAYRLDPQDPTALMVDAILLTNAQADLSIVEQVREIVEATHREKDIRLEANEAAFNSFYALSEKSEAGPGSVFGELPIAEHDQLVWDRLTGPSAVLARLTTPTLLKGLLLLVLGLALLASVSPRLRHLRTTFRSRRLIRLVLANRYEWAKTLAGLAAFHAIIAILVWLSELHWHGVQTDTHFVSGGVHGALRWMANYIVMGRDESHLQAPLSLLWLAVLKAGWAITSVMFSLGLIALVTRYVRSRRLRDHVVVVGWNRHGPKVVEELAEAARVSKRSPQIHVVPLSEVGEEDKRAIGKAGGVLVEEGDEASEKAAEVASWLEAASVHRASSVIVLGCKSAARRSQSNDDVDLWTARTVLSVARFVESMKGRDESEPTRVIAEAKRPENVPVLEQAGADEVICVRDFGSTLLAQSAARANVIRVFESLVKSTPDSYEVYTIRSDHPWIRLMPTFEEASAALRARSERLVVLGVLVEENEGSDFIPSFSAGGRVLDESDAVVFLSDRHPR